MSNSGVLVKHVILNCDLPKKCNTSITTKEALPIRAWLLEAPYIALRPPEASGDLLIYTQVRGPLRSNRRDDFLGRLGFGYCTFFIFNILTAQIFITKLYVSFLRKMVYNKLCFV